MVVVGGRFGGVIWNRAVAVGTSLHCHFYIPFVTNQSFMRTIQYLLQGSLGVDESGTVFSWSGVDIWRMVTFYNSTYFVVLLLLLLVWGIWQSVR